MDSTTFESPNQITIGGFIILILGVVMFGFSFGFGFIVITLGIYWVLKSIIWYFFPSDNRPDNRRKRLRFRRKQRPINLRNQPSYQRSQIKHQNNSTIHYIMSEVERSVSIGNFNKALGILDKAIYQHNLLIKTERYKLLRMAADISVKIPNYAQAKLYNEEALRCATTDE